LKHLRSECRDLLDWITREDPKIKGDAEDKIRAALDAFAKTFA
jgi:F-type H+-transporting ATPase subunit alpha